MLKKRQQKRSFLAKRTLRHERLWSRIVYHVAFTRARLWLCSFLLVLCRCTNVEDPLFCQQHYGFNFARITPIFRVFAINVNGEEIDLAASPTRHWKNMALANRFASAFFARQRFLRVSCKMCRLTQQTLWAKESKTTHCAKWHATSAMTIHWEAVSLKGSQNGQEGLKTKHKKPCDNHSCSELQH